MTSVTPLRLSVVLTTSAFLAGCGGGDPPTPRAGQQAATHAPASATVRVTGAMREVMHRGELFGKVALDSLTAPGTYGIGPLAYLRGEVVVWDGQPYVGRVDATPGDVRRAGMAVTLEDTARAPFLVYAQVPDWREVPLPDTVGDLAALEAYLTAYIHGRSAGLSPKPLPTAFRLAGAFAEATVHLQNLPIGSTVSSPHEAHAGKQKYYLDNIEADVIGFYSTEHHGVYTHHDTNQHLHLISSDRTILGHVDTLRFERRAVRLYLPHSADEATLLQ